MSRLNKKDLLNRNKYLKSELKIKLLKSIISDYNSSYISKTKASFILNKKLKTYSKTKIVNRCVLTSWSKSVLQPFRLSWMKFKELASKGMLPGVRKRNH